MEDRVESKSGASGKKKKRVIALLILLLLLIAAGISLFSARRKNGEISGGGQLGYESGAVTVSDADELQRLVDGMIEQAKDGTIALEYKNTATSSDGKNFACYIANSVKNKYDMYFGVYSDVTLKEELFLTKLLKPGTGIEKFETVRKLEPGSYEAVLVFTQVKDDHETIQSQASVTCTLIVAE